MTAPARKNIRVSNVEIRMKSGQNGSFYEARSFIENDLSVGDKATAFGSDTVLIEKKYNCSALVQYSDGERTVINYDDLVKL
ncbi:hypothetical protein ACYSNR_02060 [Enterococcus sp. LJL128]